MIYFISGVTLADLCRLINSPGKIYLNRDRNMMNEIKPSRAISLMLKK